MKKNFIKKLLIGGLITSLCLCCCFLNLNKNVSASEINEDINNIVYNSDFTSKFNFKNYGHIEEINDLKGTMWMCNYDVSYPSFSDEFETYTISYISPYDALQENNYLLAPFILQNPIYFLYTFLSEQYPYSLKCYSLKSSKVIEFVENFPNSDFMKKFISTDVISTSYDNVNNKFIFDNSSFNVNDLIIACNIPFEVGLFPTSQIDLTFSYMLKMQNEYDSGYWSAISTLGTANPIFLFFPNSDYTLEYSSSNDLVNESMFLEYFKTQFTLIEVENFSIWKNEILNDIEFEKGYNDGYEDGYNQGIYDTSDTSYRFPFLTGILNGVSDIMAIEIFPNVRLGYFVLIPLALGVTGMIFWFWRKD